MPVKIMSFDPGLNIGVAFRLTNDNWITTTLEKQDKKDWDMNVVAAIELIREHMPQHIVIELFSGRQMFNQYAIETTEIVGALRGACLALNIPYTRQTALQKVTRTPKAKAMLVERRSQLKLSHTDHEVSALAHLLTWEAHNDTTS